MLAGEQLLKFLRNAVSPSSQSSKLLELFDLGEGRIILPWNVTMHQLTHLKSQRTWLFKIIVSSWDTSHNLVDRYPCSTSICYFHFRGSLLEVTPIYQMTWHHIPLETPNMSRHQIIVHTHGRFFSIQNRMCFAAVHHNFFQCFQCFQFVLGQILKVLYEMCYFCIHVILWHYFHQFWEVICVPFTAQKWKHNNCHKKINKKMFFN